MKTVKTTRTKAAHSTGSRRVDHDVRHLRMDVAHEHGPLSLEERPARMLIVKDRTRAITPRFRKSGKASRTWLAIGEPAPGEPAFDEPLGWRVTFRGTGRGTDPRSGIGVGERRKTGHDPRNPRLHP